MRILWVSARNISNDLCRTTQITLANKLTELGHELSLASPGVAENSMKFNHINLKQGSIRGFQSFSCARAARRLNVDHDLIMIDWRLALILKKWLNQTGIPWYLVDRGPPADRGILSSLQWIFWKRAWKMAKRGMVVSNGHLTFVKKKTKTIAMIDVISAGVDSELFRPSKVVKERVKFIYIGKLDRNRMVEMLPTLINSKGYCLTMIGSGDVYNKLNKKWGNVPGIEIIGQVEQGKIPDYLANADIGLLPMPDKQIWRIASPLKLAEYAASGLIVAGVKHAGNNVSFDSNWLFLNENIERAIDEAVEHVNDESIRKEARIAAIEKLDWKFSIYVLNEALMELVS